MCFRHICPGCIYSSCSEQVPKPRLPHADGTLDSFFSPHREQSDGGMNNAEEMMSAERNIRSQSNHWDGEWPAFVFELHMGRPSSTVSGVMLINGLRNILLELCSPFYNLVWVSSAIRYQIWQAICSSMKVLVSYLTHSCNAVSSLIHLPFPTFPLTQSCPSSTSLTPSLYFLD